MNEALDNPAARLGFWLPKAVKPAKAAADHRKGRRQDRPLMSVRDVWANIWGLDVSEPDQLLTLFDNGLTFVKEARSIRTTVTGFDDPFAELALKHFDQVERCVAHFVAMESSSIDAMMEPMNEGGWQSLELLSTLLRQREREPVPNDETRQSLIDQTQDLIKAVLEDADLDAGTKTEIYGSLKRVQDALARFTIGGAPVVSEASDRLCGTLVRTVLTKGEAFLDHRATKLTMALLNAIGVAFGIPADYVAITSGLTLALPESPSGKGGGGGSI